MTKLASPMKRRCFLENKIETMALILSFFITTHQWCKSWGGQGGRDCSFHRFDWGASSVDCPPQSSSFRGTLLGLASRDTIKSMLYIIILNQPLLSYSSPMHSDQCRI